MPPEKSFWKELNERRVVRVGVVYLAVSWALIQGAETLTTVLDLPGVTSRLVFALVVLCFPVAIVLTWAFQVTPDGVRRAEPVDITGRRNRKFVGPLAIGIIAVSGLAFVVFGSDRSDGGGPIATLDSNTVLVMPFRVSVPDQLSYLGAGFMDLLAARLDGEVGPRAVDPGAVVTAVNRPDNGTISVARSLGAGLVLTGSIVGGASGIVASAEYSEVAGGSLRASASAAGHPDSLTAIADQLIIQLLSLSEGEYPTSIAALTSTSPAALKSYLRGKQAFRDGRYFEAINHYEEALARDSTFALAAIARADGATNALTVGDGGGLERAWRHRDRLGQRDLRYLEARLPQTPRTGAENIAIFERLTGEQPDRVEAWYWLAEAVFHATGVVHGPKWVAGTRATFERVLELDPGYFPAVDHLIFVEAALGTPERLQAISEKLYQRPRGSVFTPVFRGVARGEAHLTFDLDSLRTTDANGLALAPWWPLYAPDQTPMNFVPYVEAAFEEGRRRAGIDISLARVLWTEYRLNIAMGRPERAEAVREESIREGVVDRYGRTTIYDALWAGVALEDAPISVAAIDERLGGIPGGALTLEDARDLAAAEVWRYRQDPAYTNPAAAGRVRAAAELAPHPRNMDLESIALLIEAWSQVRQGDPRAKASLDRLVAVLAEEPSRESGQVYALLSIAAAQEELGDLRGALENLDRAAFNTNTHDYDARLWRERGRLADLTGDTARAIREYGRWLKLHVDAEASVIPDVEAVRAEVARLEGEH